MNRILASIILLVLARTLSFAALGSPAGTVLTNLTIGFETGYTNYIMDTSLTMGSVFGLRGISSGTSYNGYPNYSINIDLYLTNMGNDADNDARVFISSFSNSIGYTNTAWSYHMESAAIDVGTNYSVPFALFGTGAILHIVLAVQIPADASIGSYGYFSIGALTLSNSNHVAAVYTGFNGLTYGGYPSAGTSFAIRVVQPNSILDLYASDGIDTIHIFNGTAYLRKTENSIFARLSNTPVRASNINLWFAVDSVADGTGGNPADQSVPMSEIYSDTYKAKIGEGILKSGNYVSFLLEIDGVNSLTNYTYLLKDLHDQGYQTVVMNNIIPSGSCYLKLPESALGQYGKINIYSIAGDLVKHIFEGRLDDQVYAWDGADDQGIAVGAGMYFIVVDSEGLKEVRKVMVK
ncbi:MAG: hypothetical protein A2Y33_07815 [Spirochaetes bacterium GWF1_51_8]|nr:MAG: hypothetical protein A2Y33_07815 [Spirochaetes bacterium GWF1_51_8]